MSRLLENGVDITIDILTKFVKSTREIRRVAKLYGAGRYFLCRSCYRLAYESQRMGLADRQREKAEKIRIRLGGSGALADPFPWKPKYMHWQTYFRLREKAESAELTSLQLFLGSLERLEVALNRRG